MKLASPVVISSALCSNLIPCASEGIEFICVPVPTRIEGQNIFLEHPPKELNGMIPVFHRRPEKPQDF